MPERWVLGRASHRAAIGGRELPTRSSPPHPVWGVRVGGKRELSYVLRSNIAQIRLDLSLSCLGQVLARFANALRGESEPVRLPPQARQRVRSREKLSFVELGADRNRAIPRADPRINLVTPTVLLFPIYR
eukprot:scaffold10178_cov129-Isochrysis_galbana.AAC.9